MNVSFSWLRMPLGILVLLPLAICAGCSGETKGAYGPGGSGSTAGSLPPAANNAAAAPSRPKDEVSQMQEKAMQMEQQNTGK